MAHTKRGGRPSQAQIVRRSLGCGTLALVVFGLPFACHRSRTPEEPASYTYVAAAKELVRQHLRDPASATFSDIALTPGTPGHSAIVCGRVNARNGFGGMAGPQRFVVGAITSLESEVGVEAMNALWQRFC